MPKSPRTTGTKAKYEIIAPFKPLAWQVEPWLDKSPVLLLTGSAGGGKSRLAAEKLHGFCQKYPKSMALMVRKTRESMTNSTVLFVERTVIGKDPQVRHFPSKKRFEYANGSILAYGGMANEEQREQIRSIGLEGGLDIVWMEEATGFKESDFNELAARMRGTKADWQQIILTTNPGGPTHWINKRLIIDQQARMYLSKAQDNKHNPASYLEWLEMLTGMQYDRLVLGKWVQAEGVVYSEFDTENITDQEPDPELPIELAVDDGYIDPRAILFIQRTPTQVLVFDEIYHSRHLAQTCVEEVVAKCAKLGIKKPEIAIGPPEAKELQQRFRLADIPYRFRTHKILEGIPVVRRLIKDHNGARPLQVHKRCQNFIGELTDGYRYPEQGTKRDDEKPIDGNDHACDAFRYWAFVRVPR